MNSLRDRRGQAMVEFAIIIPFFCTMVWGFAYLSMFFHDYLTLTELTRVIARNESVGIAYDSNVYKDTTFLTTVYTWNPQTGVAVATTANAAAGTQVTVTLTAKLNLAADSIWANSLPAAITAALTMRKEE
ncbi:MAG: pilus assembly protein [Sporomusaceae bacterium]|nr:pilus assembly protein [Sporomusaceae bacterium]